MLPTLYMCTHAGSAMWTEPPPLPTFFQLHKQQRMVTKKSVFLSPLTSTVFLNYSVACDSIN